MNSYQRVFSVLNGEEPDRIPVCPFVLAFPCRYAGIKYSKYCTDYNSLVEAQSRSYERFKYDILVVDSDAYREAHACGAEIEFPEDDLPVLKHPCVTEKSTFHFNIPDIGSSPRLVDKLEGVRKLKEMYKGEVPVLGWVEAPFQGASILRGLNEFMLDLYDDEVFIKELLDFSTELGVKFGKAQIEAGADMVGIGDSVATLVSPNIYVEYILPYTKKLVAQLKDGSNIKVKYHICGDATHLLDLIAEIQADIVNIDSKVDIETAFRKLKGKTCVKGNIDPVNVLLNGTPHTITEQVKKVLSKVEGSFILSPGCEVPKDTPFENLASLVESVR
jgi:MtaA/CmuA family methyltransferase